MRARSGRIALTLVVTALLLVGAAAPATAAELKVTSEGRARVLADLTHERLVVHLANGSIARGDLLRWREDDPQLELRPHLSFGTAVGLQTVRGMANAAVKTGGVAGTNGGFTLKNRPLGVPNGLFVDAGRLVAGQAVTHIGSPVRRPSVGVSASGALVMDRLWFTMELTRPDGTTVPVDEINRRVRVEAGDSPPPASGELIVYTTLYGTPVEVPSGATLVVTEDLGLGSSGTVDAVVRDVFLDTAPHELSVPPGASVLVAHGDARPDVAGIDPGDVVSVTPRVDPQNDPASRWDSLTSALPGGNLLIHNGKAQGTWTWSTEAFPDTFIYGRNPRTAIGRTADGEILLLTIDGRQRGWSAGVMLRELTQTLQALGAVDAVNLDGGGSTTMTIDRAIRNRPSEVGRKVGSALFVHAPLPRPARDIADGACPPERVPASGFRDTDGSVHEAAIDCLAWWEVTEGVAPGRYGPEATVTRAQMASLVARWLDGSAERSSDARELPASAPLQFSDVDPDGVHADAIARLAEAGIVQGRSADHYAPRDPVTRAQMATFMVRATEYLSGAGLKAGRDTFVDDNRSVHERAVNRLNFVGVVAGTGGFSYAPADDVRRDAMASFVMRAADLMVSDGVTAPPG